MFAALLICSDPECAEYFEARAPLHELEALACSCGCGLVVLTVSEANENSGELTLVPR